MTGANDNWWQRRIYIASSTRDPEVTSLTASLREEGHALFDFSAENQPPAWAAWNNREPDGCPREVSFQRMVDLPEDEESARTFDRDMTALQEEAASASILSCSQSAHPEPEYPKATGHRPADHHDVWRAGRARPGAPGRGLPRPGNRRSDSGAQRQASTQQGRNRGTRATRCTDKERAPASGAPEENTV